MGTPRKCPTPSPAQEDLSDPPHSPISCLCLPQFQVLEGSSWAFPAHLPCALPGSVSSFGSWVKGHLPRKGP